MGLNGQLQDILEDFRKEEHQTSARLALNMNVAPILVQKENCNSSGQRKYCGGGAI